MLKDNLLKYGVLRCRDLVELYYGMRIVTRSVWSSPTNVTGQTNLLLNQDSRRIRYEILMANFDGTFLDVSMGPTREFAASNAFKYVVPGQSSMVVERNFITDGDAVTEAVYAFPNGNNFNISLRETILTPAPVDEVPLG